MVEREFIVAEWRDDNGILHLKELDQNIIRCDKCKKLNDCRDDPWQTSVISSGYIGWCNRTSRPGDVDYVKIDDFCSYGED